MYWYQYKLLQNLLTMNACSFTNLQKKMLLNKNKNYSAYLLKYISCVQYSNFGSKLSNQEIQKKRVAMFDKEAKRQNSLIIDIEKIRVNYIGLPENASLVMNKNLSTPYNCAQHINERVMNEAVLAEVDGELWDMFRPLENDCYLKFLNFKMVDPFYVNKAFWRSLSLMLGSVLETCFKDDIYVQLCSFPPPKVRYGSFVYDVDIPLESWEPSLNELRMLSGEMVKLSMDNHNFNRMEVDAKLASKMFEDNYYKHSQIPSMAAKSKSGSTITLYRVGDFIDISSGPVMSRTGHVGKCSITAVHAFAVGNKQLYRVQGVSLPKGFKMNHYAYGIIEERARKPSASILPNLSDLKEENQSEEQAVQE